MRAAAARAASRRGSSTRSFFPCAQGSAASTSGTRVVLPAPGGATRTAAPPARKALVSSGSAGSMGRGSAGALIRPLCMRAPVEGRRAQDGAQDTRKTRARHAQDKCIASPNRWRNGPPRVKSEPCQAAQSARSAPPVAQAPKKGDHVFLVDGSSYIFRAYHALPPLNRKSDGLQVNAVLGFCNMLWKLLRDMKAEERPTHLAVVFDKSEKPFRSEMYSQYKANRTEPPDDLRPQFPLIREAVRAFDLPCLEQIGFEADDLIATYVRQACEAGASATIVASDKDLMQLVTDCVVMYDTMKDRRIGVPEV